MDKKTLLRVLMALILLGLGFSIASWSGCEREKEKGSVEVIGFPQSFAELSDRVKPAVVNISTITTVRMTGGPFEHFVRPKERSQRGDFFDHYFGDLHDREVKQQSLGSGFIVDKSGYVITNNHVVEGSDDIKVKLSDGQEYKAVVVGRDPLTDLALLRISSLSKDLPVLPLGDSEKARVGDWVLAIGNPFGLEHTVTQGIISATGRVIGAGPYDNFLQTDAPINPGNSGGPLINLKGEVIGINTAIVAAGQGIGFAIPSGMAKRITSQLKDKGRVSRGWIGVSIRSVTPDLAEKLRLNETKGALVAEIVPRGPAEAAGVRKGDVIIAFDGKEINEAGTLPRLVGETPIGKKVEVKVVREGKPLDLSLTVREMEEKTPKSG